MSEEQTQSPGRSGEAERPSDGVSFPEGALAPEISRRVTAILDAVEREAEQLRADAHEEARRYLDQACRHADDLIDERRRRIAELSDEIVSKAEAVVGRLDDAAPVREGFESLVRGLGEAAERLSAEAERDRPGFSPAALHEGLPAPGPTAGPALGTVPPSSPDTGPPAWSPTPPPGPPQPPAARGPAPPLPTEPGPYGFDEGLLVAMRMAAAGQTRDQVGDHLHNSVGVPDPGSILDEVFGAGSAGGARVPWAAFPR
jgi:ElaB/YqjD/DUF883 family membrane-anchored ribosome-binding protein